MHPTQRRLEGRLKSWNDDRGFGFIRPDDGGPDVFVHIKALPRGVGRPAVVLKLSFAIEQGPQGKPRAAVVRLVDPVPAPRLAPVSRPPAWGGASYFVIPLFALLFVVVAIAWGVPAWVLPLYLGASVVCFAAYALDKSAAQSHRRRTREDTLLLLGLVGGWPGAILAQQWLRHKSTKESFRGAFWLSVAANVGLFVAAFTPLSAALWLRD